MLQRGTDVSVSSVRVRGPDGSPSIDIFVIIPSGLTIHIIFIAKVRNIYWQYTVSLAGYECQENPEWGEFVTIIIIIQTICNHLH